MCTRQFDPEQLEAALTRCQRLAQGWAGVVYRSSSMPYANRDDLLTGEGSRRHATRWCRAHLCRIVYASLDVRTANEEGLAHYRYYGYADADALPRVLAAAQASLQRVLDLTQSRIRRTLGVTTRQLVGEDWRACNQRGEEALTQAIGRLAWDSVWWEGLLLPSAANPGGINLMAFPGNQLPGSFLVALNPGRLPAQPGRRP
jgi:RES domain-containing protein